MPLYEQHRSLTAAAWRSVVLERFLRSQSAPAIAKLQVRRTRSEKVQTGGNGVQGALEGSNRVAGDSLRCKGESIPFTRRALYYVVSCFSALCLLAIAGSCPAPPLRQSAV